MIFEYIQENMLFSPERIFHKDLMNIVTKPEKSKGSAEYMKFYEENKSEWIDYIEKPEMPYFDLSEYHRQDFEIEDNNQDLYPSLFEVQNTRSFTNMIFKRQERTLTNCMAKRAWKK